MQYISVGAAASVVALGVGCYFGRLLVTSGLFRSVEFQPSKLGSTRVAVKTGKGPYQKVGKRYQTMCDGLMKKFGKDIKVKTIGIYHDDPKKFKPENLRSSIGVVLNDQPKSVEEYLSEQGYSVVTLQASQGIRASFPWKGYCSVMIFLWKVYKSNGALEKYVKAHPEKDSASPHYELCDPEKHTQALYIPDEPIDEAVQGLIKAS